MKRKFLSHFIENERLCQLFRIQFTLKTREENSIARGKLPIDFNIKWHRKGLNLNKVTFIYWTIQKQLLYQVSTVAQWYSID